MRQAQIAITSFHDDLHALIIQHAMAKYRDVRCHIIESNRICSSTGLSWSNASNFESKIPVIDSRNALDVRELNLIWWRRSTLPQQIPPAISDPAHRDLIENDCRIALTGILLNEFRGTWISHPTNSQAAENKLVQLRAAMQAGFRVPLTLVSQNPIAIRDFCEKLDYRVVVKPLKGTHKAPLFTRMLTAEHLACADSMALCPTMYQEYIPGERHIRAQCFGDSVYSVLINSKELDWRANLNVPFDVFELGEDVKVRLRKVLGLLGLRMGIVDLKFTPEGELVWFEINQQGQFLFAEGLSGLDLTSAFASFLYHEAVRAAKCV